MKFLKGFLTAKDAKSAKNTTRLFKGKKQEPKATAKGGLTLSRKDAKKDDGKLIGEK